VKEVIDESVMKRRESPDGKDPTGAKYDPPALGLRKPKPGAFVQ